LQPRAVTGDGPYRKIGRIVGKREEDYMKKALSNPNLFFIGVLAVIAVLFLASRGQGNEMASNECGRYQITSCQTGNSWCVHVLDTRTGEVKKVEDKDYGKPFDDYKKP
jgi:hypothetical protein